MAFVTVVMPGSILTFEPPSRGLPETSSSAGGYSPEASRSMLVEFSQGICEFQPEERATAQPRKTYQSAQTRMVSIIDESPISISFKNTDTQLCGAVV